MKTMQSAGVVVYTTKNGVQYYLLLHNIKGHWDFPKGKIEQDESRAVAALRELQEEACITATLHDCFEFSLSYFFTDHDGQKAHKTVYFFVGQADSTYVQLSHEHDDAVWLPLDKALQTVTFDEGKELLRAVDAFLRGKA